MDKFRKALIEFGTQLDFNTFTNEVWPTWKHDKHVFSRLLLIKLSWKLIVGKDKVVDDIFLIMGNKFVLNAYLKAVKVMILI